MSKSIYVDKYSLVFRDNKSKQGTNREEVEANAFAAELLVPTDLLIQKIESFDILDDYTIHELAKLYEVSAESLVYRLANLGLLHS
jgi:Zn-dependent peptidase ImmA (M78 family)